MLAKVALVTCFPSVLSHIPNPEGPPLDWRGELAVQAQQLLDLSAESVNKGARGDEDGVSASVINCTTVAPTVEAPLCWALYVERGCDLLMAAGIRARDTP